MVHLQGGMTEVVAVPLEAARRAVPPWRAVLLSTYWTGRLTRQRGTQPSTSWTGRQRPRPLETIGRAAPPSTSWWRWSRRQEGQLRQRKGHVAAQPLDRTAETTEPRRCPTVRLLVGTTKAMYGARCCPSPGRDDRGRSRVPQGSTARSTAVRLLDGVAEA